MSTEAGPSGHGQGQGEFVGNNDFIAFSFSDDEEGSPGKGKGGKKDRKDRKGKQKAAEEPAPAGGVSRLLHGAAPPRPYQSRPKAAAPFGSPAPSAAGTGTASEGGLKRTESFKNLTPLRSAPKPAAAAAKEQEAETGAGKGKKRALDDDSTTQQPPAQRTKSTYVPPTGPKPRFTTSHKSAPWVSASIRSFSSSQGKSSTAIDFFNFECREYVRYASPRPEENELRFAAVEMVQRAMRAVQADAEVWCFGSVGSGLYLPGGDIDMVLLSPSLPSPPDKPSGSLLRRLSRALINANVCPASSIIVIAKARVPIIKFRTTEGGFNVDLSVNMAGGLLGLEKVREMMDLYAFSSPSESKSNGKKNAKEEDGTEKEILGTARALTMLVKSLLSQRGMNEVFCGGLGSYSVICMVISFLQLHPKIQSSQIDPQLNLGLLLLDFLEYYGRYFSYEKVGISVASGGYFDKVKRGWADQRKPGLLSCEDPADPEHDISKGSFQIARIRTLFSGSFELLSASLCARQALLSSSSNTAGAALPIVNADFGPLKDERQRSILGVLLGFTSHELEQRKANIVLHQSGRVQRLLGQPGPKPGRARSPDYTALPLDREIDSQVDGRTPKLTAGFGGRLPSKALIDLLLGRTKEKKKLEKTREEESEARRLAIQEEARRARHTVFTGTGATDEEQTGTEEGEIEEDQEEEERKGRRRWQPHVSPEVGMDVDSEDSSDEDTSDEDSEEEEDDDESEEWDEDEDSSDEGSKADTEGASNSDESDDEDSGSPPPRALNKSKSSTPVLSLSIKGSQPKQLHDAGILFPGESTKDGSVVSGPRTKQAAKRVRRVAEMRANSASISREGSEALAEVDVEMDETKGEAAAEALGEPLVSQQEASSVEDGEEAVPLGPLSKKETNRQLARERAAAAALRRQEHEARQLAGQRAKAANIAANKAARAAKLERKRKMKEAREVANEFSPPSSRAMPANDDLPPLKRAKVITPSPPGSPAPGPAPRISSVALSVGLLGVPSASTSAASTERERTLSPPQQRKVTTSAIDDIFRSARSSASPAPSQRSREGTPPRVRQSAAPSPSPARSRLASPSRSAKKSTGGPARVVVAAPAPAPAEESSASSIHNFFEDAPDVPIPSSFSTATTSASHPNGQDDSRYSQINLPPIHPTTSIFIEEPSPAASPSKKRLKGKATSVESSSSDLPTITPSSSDAGAAKKGSTKAKATPSPKKKEKSASPSATKTKGASKTDFWRAKAPILPGGAQDDSEEYE